MIDDVLTIPFPQEFIPLLEKYFEYNAYPSALDRVALARKSMMTARQIEVWVCLSAILFRLMLNFQSSFKTIETALKKRANLYDD